MRASRLTLSVAFTALACAGRAPPAPAPAPAPAPSSDRARQLLNRLSFGPRAGDIAAVEHMGVDRWIEAQLHPESIPDGASENLLALLETQRKRPFELLADHPTPQELQPRLAARTLADGTRLTPSARDSMLYRQSQQSANALTQQIVVAKLLRATTSERQLQEVMVDFWENHFSVSLNKSPSRYSLVEYDRDVIRPHALGKFRDLLGAVAKSPQMLFYLDAWQSIVDSLHPTIPEAMIGARRDAMSAPPMGDSSLRQVVNRRRGGLNENYARELLELHTLGVNGGYTQHDVTEVARCLTGWSIDRPELGGPFFFRQELHDAGEKVVLGTRIPAGRGIADGEQVLDIIAQHPSTARFIATKLIVRLVSDTAPPALVDRVAQTFLRTNGDIREVVRAIVTSREFFSRAAFRAKVKTPFELVASTLRALNAIPDTTNRLAGQVARLGQPIWQRQTPDGWPDQADAWVNSGSILNRMNFGVATAQGNVPGMTIAKWAAAERLVALSATDQVEGVANELLEGRASKETRDAMLAAFASFPTDRRTPMMRLGDLVAVALGSPEFQRR
jgi:uncharacterized protein (DUF1800 family)